MKKLILILTPFLFCAASGVHADVLGGSIEASYWFAGVGGDATVGPATVDMEDDLDFSDDDNFEIAVTLEHPIPVIPNIRVKYADLDQTEQGTIGTPFDGVTGAVETNLDLSHFDLILYYEILDNWVSVDVGLDIKVFDGQLEVKETAGPNVSTTDIDEILPLLYASAEFELPLTDLSFGVEASGLTYSGNTIFDGKVRFRQGFGLAFIELGYRQIGVEVEDISNTDIDIDFGGVYISTGLDF